MPLFVAALLLWQRPVPLADLPFKHERGRVWLAGRLNDVPVSVALDTGASATVADDDSAGRAKASLGEGFDVRGVGSGAMSVRPATGLSLRLDGFTEATPVAFVAPIRRVTIPGSPRPLEVALGGDFMERYVVEIDYPARRLRLFAPSGYTPPKGLRELPIEFFADGMPVVEGVLRLPGAQEKKAYLGIDTGASGVTLTGRFAAVERLEARYPKMPEARTSGIGGVSVGRQLDGVSGRLGGIAFRAQAYVNLREEGATGPRAPFDALMGDDLLAKRRVVFDYAGYRLLIGG